MKLWMAAAVLFCVPLCASAQAPMKPCEDLKAEIGKKLDAKGVANYTLTIVDKGKESDGKVVGSCDGGKRSIVYLRAASVPKSSKEKQPQ